MKKLFISLTLLTLIFGTGYFAYASENPLGAVIEDVSANYDSAAEIEGALATVVLAGAETTAVDSVNAAGAMVQIGLVDDMNIEDPVIPEPDEDARFLIIY